MSFFGFNTSLPRDRTNVEGGGGGELDPFDPTNDQDFDDEAEDAAFEEKLRGLRAAGQEDVEIYTWGGGGGSGGLDGGLEDNQDDGLGDLLEETGDTFNDDTFGMGGGDVGKDFDFGTSEKQSSLPAFFDPNAGKVKKNDAAFASTMDDFWRMPEPPSANQQQPKPQTGPSLEEIEAQLRSQQQQPAQPAAAAAAPPPATSQRRPLTMEEVEAEMRAKRGQEQQQQQQQQQQQPSNNADFPPLGSVPSAVQPQQPIPIQLPIPPMPNPNDPNLQQAMFARMRIMLDTLPNPVQARILSLPPFMHFGVTESVVRDFPALTVANSPERLPQQIANPRLWPRVDGSPEEFNTIKFMIDTALAKIDEAYRMENKRQIRIAKIRAMAPRNNLMSRSDKDFITRIQVSQLISSDPYTDDFYAHIYFALHGNLNRVALPISSEEEKQRQQQKKDQEDESNVQQANNEEKQKKGGRQRKVQANRRENAMQRMQQQVERIVQHRKERIEKAVASASLEGALGRVSLSTTKAPRQMLQINQESTTGTDSGTNSPPIISKESESVGVGHAQNAAQQALQGASLAAQGGVQKRPALNKFEVLSILENLYDIVLNLEQSRRNAPADITEENDDPAAIEWRQTRDQLTLQLWKELRVLEPLEISDPHPFVSLLSTVKGKRILPRALRHLSSEQTLTAMTMIVASFDRLDVVRESVLLDESVNVKSSGPLAERRADVARQTEAFATSIVPGMLSLMATVPMRIVSGMLALFLERNNPVRVAQSKPGVAFLTIFLSRAASLRQSAPSTSSPVMGQNGIGAKKDIPTPSDLAQWNEIFNLLIQRLAQPPEQLTTLFPSTRAKARLPFGAPSLDQQRKAQLEVEDREVWQLMAAMAVSANMTQQQILVTGLREKILENVLEAKQWSAANPTEASSGEADLRIRNVNLLLHALNLDAAQISV